MDPFAFILSTSALLIYGTICLVSVIFTFSLNLYHKIDAVLNIHVIQSRILTPLERNINIIDDWLMNNNKKVGPLLILLSLVDLKLSFNIINQLSNLI